MIKAQLLLASFVLLAAPGPTNTLLAAAGAMGRRPFWLIAPVLLGYLASVAILTLALGPAIARAPLIGVALKIGCSLYLFYIAWRLWREPTQAVRPPPRIGGRKVFLATLLNPKGLVLAFAILPPFDADSPTRALAPLLSLGGNIALASTLWIGVGKLIAARASGPASAQMVRRLCALALGAFGIILTISALG